MQVKSFIILLNHIISVIVNPIIIIIIIIISSIVIIGPTGSIVANPFENNVYSCCSKLY